MGGFPTRAKSMILLYKERGHLYEPILYRRFEQHHGILTEYDDIFSDQNERINQIIELNSFFRGKF